MRKRVISMLLTAAMVFSMIPYMGITVKALPSYIPVLTNPEIVPSKDSSGNYMGITYGAVLSSDDIKIRWECDDAVSYNVAVKALNGSPSPGDNEPGTMLFDYTAGYTKTYLTLDASDLETAVGKWVKVYVQSVLEDGSMAGAHFYFEVHEEIGAPVLTVSSVNSMERLKLSWNEVYGAIGYDIYRSTSSSTSSFDYIETVDSGSTTSWTDTGLEYDTRYYYMVVALAVNGESDYSNKDYEWTDECTHDSGTYYSATSEEVNPLDDVYHERVIYYDERCEYCFEVVEADADVYYNTEAHEFNDAGICTGPYSGCGYAKECLHTDTTKEYYDDSDYPKYECIDENEHEVTYRYYYVCDTCGETIDGDRYFESEEEAHTFKNDVCTDCGYERLDELTLEVSVSKTEAVIGEYVSVTAEAAGGAGGYSYAYYVYENGTEVDSSWLAEETYGYSAESVGEFYFKVIVTDTDGNTVTVNSEVITVTEDTSVAPEVVEIQIYTPATGEWIDRLDPPDLAWTAIETAEYYQVGIFDSSDTWLSTTKCTENYLSLVDKLPTSASYYSVRVGAYDADGNQVGTGSSYFYTNEEKPIVATGSTANISENSVELSLTIIRNGGSAITESGFFLGDSADNLTEKYPIDGAAEKGKYSLVIDDLDEDETYYYQAYAVNEIGEGLGAVYAFSTSAAAMPLTVSPTVLEFAGNAGEDIVSVNSEGEWEVTVTEGEDWITVSRQYGYTNKNVTISVAQNDTSGERTGTVKITDDTGSEYITIEQNGDVDSTLKVNTESVSVKPEKTVVENIKITSNDDWTVTSKASWIIPSVGSGRFDDTISLTIQANTTSAQRTGRVDVVCGEHTHTITVTQKTPSRPWIDNFVSAYTVTVNEKFNLQGIVSAADDGKLEKITIQSADNTDYSVTVYANDAETYDLEGFAAIDTAAQPINNVAGTYTYVIYASANNFTIAENEISRFTVTVEEIPLEDAKVSLFSTMADAASITVKGKIDTLGSYSFEECGVILYDAAKTQIDEVVFSSYPKNNSGIFTAQFGGLTAGTTYYYKCYLKAGGNTYYAFSGYKSVVTNDAVIQDILLEVSNGYYYMDSDIYVNTGEQFSVLITQQPTTAVVTDYSIQITPSEGTELIQDRSAQVIINNTGDYTLTITLTGDDGVTCTKSVAVHAESESLTVTCLCQQNYTEPAKNKDKPFTDSFVLYPTYRGSYFVQPSYSGYNHELAKLALGLCVAGYTTNEHDPDLNFKDIEITGDFTEDKDIQDYYDRVRNMAIAYNSLGIELEDMRFYGYEESLNSNENNVAFSIAKKYANIDGEDLVILFVVLRGGGYGCEWASNFEIGENDTFAKSFFEASMVVYNELLLYINELSAAEQENLKVLITGYSRAAATANLTAHTLNGMAAATGGLDPEDIFCYGFATPRTVTSTALKTFKNNYSETFFDNIHNIINPGDVVPQMPMYHDPESGNGWNFVRFGEDHYFPNGSFSVKVNSSSDSDRKLKSSKVYERIDATYYSLLKKEVSSKDNAALDDELEHIIALLVELAGDREYFSKSFSKLINAALHMSMSEYGTGYRKYAQEILGKTDNQINAALVKGEMYANDFHNNIVKISWIADFKIGEVLYKVHADLKWICTLTYLEFGEKPLMMVNQAIIDFVNDVFNRAKIVFESCPKISLSLKETAQSIIQETAATVVGYFQLASKNSGVLVSHSPALYASWLYSFTPAEMCALFDEVYNPLLTVACPVDVYFYDNTGAVAASVVGDTITNTTEDIVITLVDDVKTIEFPDDTYRIEIVPAAEGHMDVSVANLDNSGTEVLKQYFNDVTLDTSLEYELIRTVDENGNVVYQLLDSYSNTVSNDSMITGEIQTICTQIEVIGSGTAVCEEYVSPGTYITLTAVPEENEAFIGWYIGSELISTSETHSFFAEESQVFTAKFTCGATVDKKDLYSISGTITSYGDSTEPVTIRVLDTDENEVLEMSVTGSTYTIELSAGAYILEVGKKNHVTRRYSVTVKQTMSAVSPE